MYNNTRRVEKGVEMLSLHMPDVFKHMLRPKKLHRKERILRELHRLLADEHFRYADTNAVPVSTQTLMEVLRNQQGTV